MFGNKKLKAEIKSLKGDLDRARQDTFIVLTEQKKSNLELEKTISYYEEILSDCYVRDSKGRFMRYKKEYRVTEKDIMGDLKGFPIEVVQKIVDYQVKQGNKVDVTVFQKDITSTHGEGGVSWGATQETFDFFHDIVKSKNFNLFFNKYPKKNK